MTHIGLQFGCGKSRLSKKERLFGHLSLLCARLIVSLEKILTLGKAKKKDFSAIFLCFALA